MTGLHSGWCVIPQIVQMLYLTEKMTFLQFLIAILLQPIRNGMQMSFAAVLPYCNLAVIHQKWYANEICCNVCCKVVVSAR